VKSLPRKSFSARLKRESDKKNSRVFTALTLYLG